MKIYEFKYSAGETDWVFAPNKEEAESFYIGFTGCGDLEGVEVVEIPKEEWSQTYIIDPNQCEPNEEEEDYDEEDYCNSYKIVESFEDYAKRNSVTDMIATTEF